MDREIVINGVTYVPKDDELTSHDDAGWGTRKKYLEEIRKMAEESEQGLEYVIVRTYSAGVFAGWRESHSGQECILRKARRLWRWEGAASLSQLAMEGVKNPKGCKFPCEVDKVELTQVIETCHCTEAARLSIAGVPIWSA